MDNKQQLNSIGTGAYFPIKLTEVKDSEGNPVMVPKLEVTKDSNGKEVLKPVLKLRVDQQGNTMYQTDNEGNLILDEEGNPIPLYEPVMEPKVTWHPLVGDPVLIKQNLVSLISYHLGQKLRQENFGTRIWECIEEPNTQIQRFLVKQFILDGINAWEPRIKALDCNITAHSSILHITLKFNIHNSSSIEELNFNFNPQNDLSYVSE